MDYFLYRHVRSDNNEVFYVGIGARNNYGTTFKKKYARAFNYRARTVWWKNISTKTTFEVEILFETKNLKLIRSKEIEFIKLYGRKDLGKGTLVNLSDGGEFGAIGALRSEETKKKMRDSNYWKGETGSLNPFSQEVFVYSINGIFLSKFGSAHEAARMLGRTRSGISSAIKSKRHVHRGYMFYKEYQGENVTPPEDEHEFKRKKVYMFNLNGDFIKLFNNPKEAISEMGYSHINNFRFAVSKNKKYKGYYWSYIPGFKF